MIAEIEEAFSMDEYSGAASYNIDDVNFIDTVNGLERVKSSRRLSTSRA
jgi:hypothetical protein